MSDPADTGQRNPLSSSSSHASGTSARSVTVPLEHVAPVAEHAALDARQPEGDTVPTPEAQFQGDELSREPQAGNAGQQSGDWADKPDADTGHETARDVAAAQPDAELEPEHLSPASEAIHEAALLGEAEQPEPADAAVPSAEDEDIESAGAVAEAEPVAAFVETVEAVAEDEPAAAFADDKSDASVDEDEPAEAFEAEPVAAFDEPEPAPRPTEPALRIVPALSPAVGALPEDTSELRALARQTIAENEARQQTALSAIEQLSRRFTLALEEAGIDAARVSFKVMEFAQASMKNNLELAQSYAAARSVPDIFGLHAAYLARQLELLNAQAEELREIAAKMTMRGAASLTPQAEPANTSPDR